MNFYFQLIDVEKKMLVNFYCQLINVKKNVRVKNFILLLIGSRKKLINDNCTIDALEFYFT